MVGLSSGIGDLASVKLLLLMILLGLSGIWMDHLNAFSIHFFCFAKGRHFENRHYKDTVIVIYFLTSILIASMPMVQSLVVIPG